MASRYIIYGLFDPQNQELRYVGKSCSGLNRPRHHSLPSSLAKDRTYKGSWLRQLVGLGLRPEIVVLEVLENREDLIEAEVWNIAYWRSLGCNLTNLTSGGDGLPVGYRHSVETRQKMSKSRTGRIVSNATRQKIGNAHRGKIISEEQRIAISRKFGVRAFRCSNGKTYNTASEAARDLECQGNKITLVLRGLRKSHKGLVFFYE